MPACRWIAVPDLLDQRWALQMEAEAVISVAKTSVSLTVGFEAAEGTCDPRPTSGVTAVLRSRQPNAGCAGWCPGFRSDARDGRAGRP